MIQEEPGLSGSSFVCRCFLKQKGRVKSLSHAALRNYVGWGLAPTIAASLSHNWKIPGNQRVSGDAFWLGPGVLQQLAEELVYTVIVRLLLIGHIVPDLLQPGHFRQKEGI